MLSFAAGQRRSAVGDIGQEVCSPAVNPIHDVSLNTAPKRAEETPGRSAQASTSESWISRAATYEVSSKGEVVPALPSLLKQTGVSKPD